MNSSGSLSIKTIEAEQVERWYDEDDKDKNKARKGIFAFSKDFIVTCWAEKDSRNMLLFFIINMLFMVVELGYGLYSNSLGLISDAFHMLSDNISLIIALIATYISMSSPADSHYNYGYGRIEVLSGLFNGIFLVFVALEVFSESIERIYEP
jgi:zinc transporter 5/7